jgi:hypothetical protein
VNDGISQSRGDLLRWIFIETGNLRVITGPLGAGVSEYPALRQDCQLRAYGTGWHYGESERCVAARQGTAAGLAKVGSKALRVWQFKAAAIVFTACPANVRSDGDDKVAGVARAGRPAAT